MNDENPNPKKKTLAIWLFVCLALGLGIGTALGHIALSAAIGLVLGFLGPRIRHELFGH